MNIQFDNIFNGINLSIVKSMLSYYLTILDEINHVKTFHDAMTLIDKCFAFIDFFSDDIKHKGTNKELWDFILVYNSNICVKLSHQISSNKFIVNSEGPSSNAISFNNNTRLIITEIEKRISVDVKKYFIVNLLHLEKLYLTQQMLDAENINKILVFNNLLPSLNYKNLDLLFSLPQEYLNYFIKQEYTPKKRITIKDENTIIFDFSLCNTTFYYDFYQLMIKAVYNKDKVYLEYAQKLINNYIEFLTSKKNNYEIPRKDITRITNDFNLSTLINALDYAHFVDPEVYLKKLSHSARTYLGNYHIFRLSSDPIDRVFFTKVPDKSFYFNSFSDENEFKKISNEYDKNDPLFFKKYHDIIPKSKGIQRIRDLNLLVDEVWKNEIYYREFIEKSKASTRITAAFSVIYLLEDLNIENKVLKDTFIYLFGLYLGKYLK